MLAIGPARKAWPLLLLHVVNGHDDDSEGERVLFKGTQFSKYEKLRLSTCWRALGLPTADEDWTNTMTLD